MYDFSYTKPICLADAVLALNGLDAKALAGGQSFIPVLKQRLNRPSLVVDLAGLGLSGITVSDDAVTIGATTTHAAVAANSDVQKAFPALACLAAGIGDLQVRHRGTIGGSLANNDPAADYPAVALATAATLHTTTRTLTADEFFQGMFTTALEPDEIITAVSFPIPHQAAYVKFRNPASRYAMVGVFVARGEPGVRVAVTGAGQNGVFRHAAMEQALSRSWSPAALEGIATPAEGLNSDIHGSADYRAHLVGVMAKRAVGLAES
jgi:carbon-monoxide dehydrogenase medium subunit